MLATKPEPPPSTSAAHQRATFFRQSGWLMIATVAGGFFMYGVHLLAKSKSIPQGVYGEFGVYLALVMCVPQAPLQMMMAQQTARGLATGRTREVAGVFRLVSLGTFGLWLAAALVMFGFQKTILEHWQITSPVGLWVTIPAILLSMWMPLFQGILQGQQNFLWLGWSQLSNGVLRLVVAALAVLALGGQAPGMMAGVLAGLVFATAVAVWQSRTLWSLAPKSFDWRELLRQVVPLMLGFGAIQFLFTSDTMFVKNYFTAVETGAYVSAGTLCRALMWMVGPMVTVMFPRIIHSTAKAEKTDLVGLVLIGTAVIAITGSVCLALLGPWVVSLVYTKEYVAVATQILPWYAGAMVPLALANVLLNSLLARSAFKIVLVLCVMVPVYILGLTRFHSSLVMVLQVMSVCNLLVLAASAWFTWGPGKPAPKPLPATAAA